MPLFIDRRGDQEASQGIEVPSGGWVGSEGKTPRMVTSIRKKNQFDQGFLSSCFSGPGGLKIVSKEET